MKGCFIRSRSDWIDNGEKPTKMFCNLEKRNFLSKNISCIQREDGTFIYEPENILKEANCFYKTLYSEQPTTNPDLKNEFKNDELPKLTNLEADMLEGILSLQEVSLTLKHMKNDKSPGSDGFSANFFKVFWKKLGDFVVRSINYSYNIGSLSITQKQGIITCIPKEGKPKQFLKNWRPICLLNTVYKLASGTIANRLKSTLNKLVNNDQTGFIKGSYMGDNTRLLYDIMSYTDCNQIPGLLMLIDFEKAFDTLSFSFIKQVFDFFNFGPMFKNWIALFFNNMENAVQLNGFLSDFFIIGRGCRQGDPISAYIFILCAEILAIKIRKCKQMKGITIDNEEYKISQFADDTYLLMDGSEETLNTTLQLLHSFSQYSGLNVNFEKTHVVWIGSLKYSTRSIKTRWKLVWGCTQFKLLGLNFDVDLPKMIELNYNDKLVKLENIIAHWNRRELTPLGRITVVKTLILPMFIHLFVSLPQPGEAICKVLNDKVLKFVWQGPSKIKAKVITKYFDEGGLKMLDINAFMKSLKLSWIRKVIQGQNKFTSLA